mgnify:FL=1
MKTLNKTQKEVIQMTQKEFQDLLVENTDRNYHTENVVYIAYRYGDNFLISYAEMVLIAHLNKGEMTPKLQSIGTHILKCLKARMLPCHQQTIWECL